jgi:hypothetical protein
MREVENEHTGDNMSKYLLSFIKDYGIETKLGYIIMDNATDRRCIYSNQGLGVYPRHVTSEGVHE